MAIRLVPITKQNWEEAARLEVLPEQIDFIAPNVWSIAETQFYPWTTRCAILDDQSMVGFLVYGRDPDDGQWWLHRFMIDLRFQRRGFGRAALLQLIARLRAETGCTGVTVGYQPENIAAELLYLAAGFRKGPPAPWGESTARLDFAPTPGMRVSGAGIAPPSS